MKYPPPANPSLEKNGATLFCADTIPELADQAGIPVDTLTATLHTYHSARDTGTAGYLPVPRSVPSGQTIYAGPTRHEIPGVDAPPFRAIPVAPGITFTMGGPLIDGNARVLHESGAPIAGLYAAGASSAGFDGGEDVGYAGGLVKAAVTGVVAAEHIASLRPAA
jgi:fumarate reductase flavoprotein subunit